MEPESPRQLLVRLGVQLQAIAHHRDVQLRDARGRVGRGTPDVSEAMLWTSGREGSCIFLSQGWTAQTGQPLADGLGSGWLDAVHAEDRERARRGWTEAHARQDPFCLDLRLRSAGGGYRWVIVSGRPRYEGEEQFSGCVGSVLDVHELIQAEETRREERARYERALQEADRRKDEFLATLSHELRNPLAPLRTALHLLRRGAGDAAASAAILEMMERQLGYLVRLTDDLLDVSRITRGTIELRRERVELQAVLRNAVETSRPLIDAGAHHLFIDLPHEPLAMDADPVRLAQVFANLLNNAAKYTPPGGQIFLSARRDGGKAVVDVRDTGAGIEPVQLSRLFQMFARGESSAVRSQSGLGIGLALARRLAEMHGGTVRAHSAGPGKGSRFTVVLPFAGR